ncbi:MAG: iron-containing alcohol dehydrogenase [Desulfobacteraceae bacterium]|nr:iron-containing alcohol dehydrogenase [Desulfobacteraceae bacterium]
MDFSFFSPAKILFGPDASRRIASSVSGFGTRAFVVTGKNPARAGNLITDLEQAGISCRTFSQSNEPAVEEVALGAEQARAFGADFVVAIGGGSVLDAAKVISALVTNKGDIHDYLEVVGKGRAIDHKPVPLVVLPTTAGTGAEATCNAVVASREHGVKVSMRSPLLYPDLVIIDPGLTLSMPKGVTAATGMDALTQLMEAFVTPYATPFTDALCREGLLRVSRSFQRAFECGEDLGAREDMCVASLFSGIALANAKLGAVHGIAGPMGGMIDASHGGICARLLAPVSRLNMERLEKLDSGHPSLAKYRETAQILTGNSQAEPGDGVDWIDALVRLMEIPSLTTFGLNAVICQKLGDKALAASSMKGNPVRLTREEIVLLLENEIRIS